MRVGGYRHDAAALPLGSTAGTRFRGSCVGPRTYLDESGKFRPPSGIPSPDHRYCSLDMRTLQVSSVVPQLAKRVVTLNPSTRLFEI
jgi:hypothetical protein